MCAVSVKTAARRTQTASAPVGESQRVGPWMGTHIWKTRENTSIHSAITENNRNLITASYHTLLSAR